TPEHRLDRVRRRGTPLDQHLELAARDGGGGPQEIEPPRQGLDEAERDMDQGTGAPGSPPDGEQELFVGQDLRPPELEHADRVGAFRRERERDRKSTRLTPVTWPSRMPSSA